MAKYIFVSGGVASSIGKGITVASLGRLLTSRGIRVSVVKLDPYINVDPGTMNPYQHGDMVRCSSQMMEQRPIWTSATTSGSSTSAFLACQM
jgi:hypothetical protein